MPADAYFCARQNGMDPFKEISTFAFFVGYPRSGHSLVGACLDAHPNAVVSHELDALGLLQQGLGRTALFEAICDKARSFYETGSEWSGYSYQIPGMWQGRYETIRLIGDKRGGTSVRHLEAYPELLDEVKQLAADYRIIHITRNPFDCIATAVAKRAHKQQKEFNAADLMRKAGHFFHKASIIEGLMAQEKSAVITLRHEDLMADPEKVLTELLSFLGLPVVANYLEACSTKIWPSAQKSRLRINLWEPTTIDFIQNQIDQYPFFAGYTFEQ
ncbi:MAG: hypothetical protein C7N36_13265 [Bacteroidetes bacterium]|nr:MAG: hypothetical protein C7N36_13265 [Bacteroidota bacterium]